MIKVENIKIGDFIEELGFVISLNPMYVIHEHLQSYGKLEVELTEDEISLVEDEILIQTHLINSFCDIQDTIHNTKKALVMLEDTYPKTEVKNENCNDVVSLTPGDIENYSIIVDISEDELFDGGMGKYRTTMISNYEVGDVICGIIYAYSNKDNYNVELSNTSKDKINSIYDDFKHKLNLTIENLTKTQKAIAPHINDDLKRIRKRNE